MSSPALLTFNCQLIAIAHSLTAASSFIAALIIGCYLHYEKIVKNEFYGYPDEWFPSVSATIGDRYPERSVFQVIIALTAGPRFLFLFLSFVIFYYNNNFEHQRSNKIALAVGVLRTFTCGGWVYITSTDDHDFHDIFMISYIVLTLPWNIFVIRLTTDSNLRNLRKFFSFTFFGLLVPLVYLFIQHKVHRVKGAYSYYAYVEWSLILFDVLFDSVAIAEFKNLKIQLSPVNSKDDEQFLFTNFNVDLIKQKKPSSTSIAKGPKSSDSPSSKLSPKFTIGVNDSNFSFSINVINAFIFWTNYTALFLCIWYFPLWNMGISGYETVILVLLAPWVSPLIPFLKSPNAYKVTRFISCASGIGSFLIVTPEHRLLLISLGTFLGITSLILEFRKIKGNPSKIKAYTTSFLLGLTISTISKYAFWTNNPIWPIMNSETGGWNYTGLIVGCVSALFTNIESAHDFASPTLQQVKTFPKKLSAALAFGSLIFSMSAMLTDSSTIILWNWEGFPVNGPIPVPHGAITIIVMLISTFIGYTTSVEEKITLVNSIGVIGALVLYFFNNWLGFTGGLFYAFWLVLLTPSILTEIIAIDSFFYYGLAFLFTVLLSLAHVWVVAYAFVPAGWILRERTDIVLGLSVVMILSVFIGQNGSSKPDSSNIKKSDNIEEKTSSSLSKGAAFISLKKKLFNFCFLLSALAVFISLQRFQMDKPKPYHPDSRLITAGIWTIHFGLDNDMWASEHRMRDLIKDAELDVVGLLESDTQRIIMGNRDLTQRIAEELGMYVDFGPGPNKHTWGAALLSKFPIVKSTHHLLPSPVGELAPAIHATLDCYGEYVDIVVFHSGQEEDVEDRRLQSLGVADIMGSSDRPMILLSYLVTTPKEGNYNTYVSDKSGMQDIDESDWDRWCEYILFKKLQKTGYARISRSTITDTELQVGKFIVPKGICPTNKESIEDIPDTTSKAYTKRQIQKWYQAKQITNENEIALYGDDLKFPDKFFGDGVRGHQYHVFDEPRYFQL